MEIRVFDSKSDLAQAAAEEAAKEIRQAIEAKDQAVIVAATGVSQFDFLEKLIQVDDIDWSKTVFFHLDEYVGLPEEHPASFRKYLKERVLKPLKPSTFHFIEGDHPNPSEECERLNREISKHEIDIAFVGIGENGHLAFNDPPADFETEKPFLIVELDRDCRQQQLGEGWFKSLEEVPRQAISMSIRQIMKSNQILCIAPEKRKAEAVSNCFQGEISAQCPASILREHPRAIIFLDHESASELSKHSNS